MATTEYADFTDAKLAEYVEHFTVNYEAAAAERTDCAPYCRYVALLTLHGAALELHARWERALSPVAKLVHEMAATYDPAAARFAKGTAVYLGSQAWTVGYEVDGLAQITRGDQTRFVGTDELSPVTAEDEHRAAAFTYLGCLS